MGIQIRGSDDSISASPAGAITVADLRFNNKTTAERNAGVSTAIGVVIYNSTSESIEAYGPNGWVSIGSIGPLSATGGDFVINDTSNNRKIHIFTTSGTFQVDSGASPTGLDVLVVGGGGGGGGDPGGGGGGAGGLVFRPAMPSRSGPFNIPISIGTGGNGGGSSGSNGSTGGDTTFDPGGSWALTAVGGGGGKGPTGAGLPGGSGGGVAKNGGQNSGGSATQPGQPGDSGTYGHGNRGGNMGPPGSSGTGAAGGGGAGTAGSDHPGTNDETGVPGGDGYQVPAPFLPTNGPYPAPLITAMGGIPTASPAWRYFAGGGGGGTNAPGPAGSGGLGGGGDGSAESGTPNNNDPAPAGLDGRGGGGGGARWSGNSGGPGGDGIVIVSYPTA